MHNDLWDVEMNLPRSIGLWVYALTAERHVSLLTDMNSEHKSVSNWIEFIKRLILNIKSMQWLRCVCVCVDSQVSAASFPFHFRNETNEMNVFTYTTDTPYKEAERTTVTDR